DYTTTALDEFGIGIVTEGANYEDGTHTTKLMPRITTVTDESATVSGNGKVRVYYSQDELDAALVSDPEVNGWFRYNGSADDVITDIYSDGVFDEGMAELLVPDAFGVEDGVSYVEFH